MRERCARALAPAQAPRRNDADGYSVLRPASRRRAAIPCDDARLATRIACGAPRERRALSSSAPNQIEPMRDHRIASFTDGGAFRSRSGRLGVVALALAALVVAPLRAQQQAPAPPASNASNTASRSADSATRSWTTADDHKHMMRQLGITALRPGPSGNEQAPNAANYDESKANPYPNLPPLLTLKNGQRVTSPRLWARRRSEIVEDFEREVVGRVPKNRSEERRVG